MRRPSPRAVAALLVSLPALVAAQPRPMEYARPSPAPERVAHGELIAFARDHAAARDGDLVLVAWIDHTRAGDSQLRTTLLRREEGALVRARPDAAVATALRTPTLAWDAHGGLLAWVVPPAPPPPPPPGAPRRRPVAPPPDDTLGPSDRSGGDLVVQRLDAEGRPTGPARVVFHENSRLLQVALRPDGRGAVLAWSGGVVVDDEVRETVRVLRLGDDLAPTTPMALNAGFVGSVQDALTLSPRGEHAFTLSVRGSDCRARAELPPPALLTDDASARVEAPNRSLMPQQPLRELEGPPVECDPVGRYETVLAPGAPLARLRRVDPLAAPASRPVDLTLRERPPAGFEPPSAERPVPPPDPSGDDPFAAPRARAEDPNHLAVIDRGGRTLAVRARGQTTVRATSPLGFAAITLLPGEPALVLSREGVWSGPLRAWIVDGAPAAPVALPRATIVPAPARPEPAEPYVYDEAFARLWVRARAARATFMRHENLAGVLASRPEAPTDPRMPPILAARARLRARWESACGGLLTRAAQLARHGAGPEVSQAARSMCEMPADLVLGQPINQAL